jgi:hypothetical protein
VIIQAGESMPFVNEILHDLNRIISDLSQPQGKYCLLIYMYIGQPFFGLVLIFIYSF